MRAIRFVLNTRSSIINHSLIGAAIALCLAAPAAMAQQGRRDPAEGFAPLVTFSDTTARCERIGASLLQRGEAGYILRFGSADSAQRTVSAVWDAAGHLDHYSDARGDLRGPKVAAARPGARTTIAIDVAHRRAVLLNEAQGKTRGAVLTTAAVALDAPNLGPPRALLERLHRQCGAPAFKP